MRNKPVFKRGPKTQHKVTEFHGHSPLRTRLVNLILEENNSVLMDPEEVEEVKRQLKKRDIYDERLGPLLIEHMGSGKSYRSFAGTLGIPVNQLAKWEDDYPSWVEWKSRAVAIALRYWEDRLDAAISREEKADAKLMVFRLKNLFPEDFKDKVEYEDTRPTTLVIQGLGDMGGQLQEFIDDTPIEAEYSEVPDEDNDVDLIDMI